MLFASEKRPGEASEAGVGATKLTCDVEMRRDGRVLTDVVKRPDKGT